MSRTPKIFRSLYEKFLAPYEGYEWLLPRVREIYLSYTYSRQYSDLVAYYTLFGLCYKLCDSSQFSKFLDDTYNDIKFYLCYPDIIEKICDSGTIKDPKNAVLFANLLDKLDYELLTYGEHLTLPLCQSFLPWVLAHMDMGYDEYNTPDFNSLLPLPNYPIEYVFDTCISALRNPRVRYHYLFDKYRNEEVEIASTILRQLYQIDDMKLRNKLIDFYYNLEKLSFLDRLKQTVEVITPMYNAYKEYQDVLNAITSLTELERMEDEWMPLPEMVLDRFMLEDTRLRKLYTETTI